MLKMQRLRIDLRPVSWNKQVRKNRWAYKKVSDEWKIGTTSALVSQKLIKFPPEAFPLAVAVIAHWKGRHKHDIDSLYVKPVFDTIADFGIIPDDNIKFIERVTYYGRVGEAEDFLEIIMLSKEA